MPTRLVDQDELLELLTSSLLAAADGALARVWLIGPGDLCEGCPMRDECPDQTRCLHLIRSDGLSQRIDGPFRRFPIGARRVGRVPETMETYFSNDHLAAEGLADRTWLMAHDVRAFAATPIVSNGVCAGVAAVFSRTPLDPARLRAIETIAALAGGALAAVAVMTVAGKDGDRAAATAVAAPSGTRAPHEPSGPAPANTGRARSPDAAATGSNDLPLLRPWDDIERDILRRVLDHAGGRVSGPRGAAAILGLKPTTLQSRMKKLGVPRSGA